MTESHEADLVAYYENEVGARSEREIPEPRLAHRAAYVGTLYAERRSRILEVGRGPGPWA